MNGTLETLEQAILKQLGIQVRENRRETLQTALERRARELHRSPAEHVSRAVEDRTELARLAGAIAVGETYFFRHPQQIDLLEELLKERARERRQLRIWSAGCSSGEEAYTAAMVAREAAPFRDLQVVGTDVNEETLEAAREGFYRARSIKNTPPHYMKTYFDRPANGAAKVSDKIREHVVFRRHNLFSDPYPRGWDIILCRNVLIYFSPETAGRTFQWLLDALEPGGFLILGPSESATREGGKTRWNSAGTAFAYRRPEAEDLAPITVETPSRIQPLPRNEPSPRTESSPSPTEKDSGRRGPERGIEEAIRLLSEDSPEAALKVLRQMLYLRPDDPTIHLHLGLAWRALGDESAAIRHLRLARDLADNGSESGYDSRLVHTLSEQALEGR